MKKTKLTFIADTHHYSRKLGDNGPAYERRSSTDQKCLAETGDIIDKAFEIIADSDTDALMIVGDLSNDGERASHEEMIEKLYKLKQKKPVYVTLATHDWCCDNNARRYDGDSVFHDVDTVKHTELREMYYDFGPRDAKAEFITHLGTSSYKIEFPNDIILLSLIDDQDGEGASGFTPDHLEWIINQIKEETEKGKLVIGMEHHLLYQHISPLFSGHGLCCGKHEMYIEKFCEAGMKFVFVGHSHMQRIDLYVSENGNTLYEINVGSLVGYPAPIVNMTVTDKQIKIDTEHLKEFMYNGEILSSEYLKAHATRLITKTLGLARHGRKEEFVKTLVEFGIGRDTAEKLRPIFSFLERFLNSTSVYTLGTVINFASFGKTFNKSDLIQLKDKKIIDIVNESFLSLLDGALTKHEEGTAYYNVVTSFVHIPNKLLKALRIKHKKANILCDELDNMIKEIVTGGAIDNNHLTLDKN